MSGSFFSQLFTSIAEGGRALLDSQVWRASGARASVAAVTELCQSLVSQRGEASGAALAIETLAAYQTLDADDRAVFFERLLDDFAPDSEGVLNAAEAYRSDPSQANLLALGGAYAAAFDRERIVLGVDRLDDDMGDFVLEVLFHRQSTDRKLQVVAAETHKIFLRQ